VRGNRLFGEWAAVRLGLLGKEGEDYANSVVHAQFEEPGVVAKIGIDLRTKGIVATDDELRSELARFTEEAERQIMAEWPLLAPSIRAASCVAGRVWIRALCRQGEALQRSWRSTPRQQNEIERPRPGGKTAITGARRNPLLSWPRSLSPR
jgi:hypothetical protein